jgi:Uncharacterised nucleotidyltransferase
MTDATAQPLPPEPAEAAALWRAVEVLTDASPSLDDLRAHGLHLVAARRRRFQGAAVPELRAAERLATVRAVGVPLTMRQIRDATPEKLILIKGPELARLYPDATTREYGDLDILVRDAPAVQRHLLDAGFELIGDPALYEDIHHLRPVWHPGSPVAIEVHSEPKWVDHLPAPGFDEIAAFARPSDDFPGFGTLRPEAHAVLLAVHSWAHEPLARLSHLVDIAVVMIAADRKLADRIARDWNVAPIWRTTLRAVDALFWSGKRSFPLTTWARSATQAKAQTVLESHLSRWMAPIAAYGIGGLRVVGENVIDDLRRLPDETWREKLARSLLAFRNARTARVRHVHEIDGIRKHNDQ